MTANLTLAQLAKADACQDQRDLFEKLFGQSVVVTPAKARKVAGQFDWDWAARLLDASARAEYDKARASARAEYDKARASALAECKKAIAPAWAEYKKAIAPAWADYDKARASALAEYNKATASAWAAAYITTCKRSAGA